MEFLAAQTHFHEKGRHIFRVLFEIQFSTISLAQIVVRLSLMLFPVRKSPN